MKKVFLMMGLVLFSVMMAHTQVVGADRELQTNLEHYKTYAWTDKINNIPGDAVLVGTNGVLVFNNETTRNHIKEAIAYELDARGYKMTTGNPDFIVSFQVLEQPAELTVYNGYRTINNGLDTVRTPDNVGTEQVKAGTVLINFVDFKTGRNVWQGYASGILEPNMANDQAKVRNAISAIFREYQYKAFKN